MYGIEAQHITFSAVSSACVCTCVCASVCVYPSRMGTFVTLAEVLEARGSPLDEDEVWCLLLTTAEALLDISKKGNHSSVLLSSIIRLLFAWKGVFVRQHSRAFKTNSFELKQRALQNITRGSQIWVGKCYSFCSALCLGSGNMCNMLGPGSVLLSANGSLAFKSCPRYEDVASFTAPEVQQGHAASTRTAAEKVGTLVVRMSTAEYQHLDKWLWKSERMIKEIRNIQIHRTVFTLHCIL